MTRPHLRRSLVVVAASALFAAAASGSALAWSGTVSQVALVAPPTATAVDAPSALEEHTPQAAAPAGAAHVVNASAALRSAAAPRHAARAATKASTKKAASHARSTAPGSGPGRTITISSYVDAPGSQSQIDKCHLVLWTRSPLWLAGHNWCGYQWLAFVPTGATVVVARGAAAGRYVVTGHLTLHRQSGSLPSLSADLVLQTCVGSSTGLTLLHRA